MAPATPWRNSRPAVWLDAPSGSRADSDDSTGWCASGLDTGAAGMAGLASRALAAEPLTAAPGAEALAAGPDCAPWMAAISCPLRSVPAPRMPSEPASCFSSGSSMASSPDPLRLRPAVPSSTETLVTSAISVTCVLLVRALAHPQPSVRVTWAVSVLVRSSSLTDAEQVRDESWRGALSTLRPDLEGAAAELGAGTSSLDRSPFRHSQASTLHTYSVESASNSPRHHSASAVPHAQ